MFIEKVKPQALNTKEIRSLSQMNAHEDGLLLGWLQNARKTNLGTIFMALQDNEILGWAMLSPNGQTGYWTKVRYRGRGVASKLIDEMYQEYGEPLQVDWSCAPDFFEKNSDKVVAGSNFYKTTRLLAGN